MIAIIVGIELMFDLIHAPVAFLCICLPNFSDIFTCLLLKINVKELRMYEIIMSEVLPLWYHIMQRKVQQDGKGDEGGRGKE